MNWKKLLVVLKHLRLRGHRACDEAVNAVSGVLGDRWDQEDLLECEEWRLWLGVALAEGGFINQIRVPKDERGTVSVLDVDDFTVSFSGASIPRGKFSEWYFPTDVLAHGVELAHEELVESR